MKQSKILSFIILLGIVAGGGFLHADLYYAYPLGISGENADLRSDNNNGLHIMWAAWDYSRGTETLYYARIVNNAITGQETVATGVQWQYCRPRMSVRPDGGSVHAIWTDLDRHNLNHSWRDANGWHTETVWGYDANLHWYWEAGAIDGSETMHIICGRVGSSGNSYLYYTQKPNNGAWSTPVAITPLNQGDWVDTFMVNDPNGGIHARWDHYDRYLRYRYCASGGNLGSATTVSIPGSADINSMGMGDIFVTPAGDVHLALNTYSAPYVNVDHSFKPVGGSWTTPTRASVGHIYSGGENSYEIYPTVGVGRDNKTYVAWSQGKPPNTPNLVKLSIYDDGAWTLYTLDPAAGMDSDSIKCTIAVVSNAVYGIWRTGNKTWVLGKIPTTTIDLTAPNGGENWVRTTTQRITWDNSGLSGTVKLLLYQNLNLIGTIASDLAVGTGAYSWTVGNLATASAPAGSNYKVRIQTTDGTMYDESDGTFNIISEIEAVTAPTTPSGVTFGSTGVSYAYSTGGAVSSHGHAVQYKLDWGDNTDSGWLASGTTSASHTWSGAGTYPVKAMARCSVHTTVESPWSPSLAVVIAVPGSYFNSPANRQIMPEVIWASATGGGTWASEVQVVDISGGSRVSVYYNTSGGRRGPFVLWDNSSGTGGSSMKYNNLLQTIDGLDAGAFTYSGTVGAVEFVTQDGSHLLHVAARTVNGDYSKTFPGLNDVAANTADTSRQMVLPNMTANGTYRSSIGCFNPSADGVTMEFRLVDGSGALVGSAFSKTLGGYGYTAFSPFTDAGVGSGSYDNVKIYIRPTSGSGRVMPVGASANNVTNDPAAHIAVQAGNGYETSPTSRKILPEVIWASATGGGTWVSEVQVVDMTGGSQVWVYYNTSGGRQGPFLLWDNSGGAAGSSRKYGNMLQTIDGLDAGAFTYSGTVGAVELAAQDGAHLLHVATRTLNGDYSKTFPGLNDVAANTVDTSRQMVLPNMTANGTYRSSIGCFNPSSSSVTVEFRLVNGSGALVGSAFSKTLGGYGYTAFSPFTDAGVGSGSYDNVKIYIRPTSGSGRVMPMGASANNNSNDPAAHVAVQN
jgi:hypothetical protein